ncbi:MAG: exodeoxyribonuclease VII small subunit [Phycisphaerae bacterium]|nr:exodeoxyribonuclease VII small subunit [Phycisphaerae bacterium]
MARPARQSKPTGARTGADSGADAEAGEISGMRYEQALSELESIVQRVEDGELPLEEGIKAHRRALLLLRHCEGILDAAQARIEEISGDSLADPNDDDDDADDGRAGSRE